MGIRRDGFSLAELLTVIVVVAVLSALAIPRFLRTRERAYYASMIHDLNVLQTMEEIYYHNDGFAYKTSGTIVEGMLEPDLVMQASKGVTITLGTHPAGWAATATHEALPGEECNIFWGTAGTVGHANTPGQITCSG